MAEFSVVAASKKKEIEGRNGPLQVLALTLAKEGEAAPVMAEWLTKTSTSIPVPGSKLDGDLEESPYGLRFKRAQNNINFGGGGRQRDPATEKRITRMASQERALRYMVAKGIQDFKLDDDFRKVIDWFQRDADEAGNK